MSVEVEKINLCSLKMDETFNLWGRNVCIILARSCNIDEIVGSHECQVISLYFTVCVYVCVCVRACVRVCVRACVCVFPSASLSQCVGTWAAKLLHGLIDFMPSSHIYSHLLSDSPPSSRSSSFSFGPLPMAMVHLSNQRLSRKWEAAWWEEDLPWVLCKPVTWRGGASICAGGWG